MSWKIESIELQKEKFIRDWLKREFTMTLLCERYEVSRQSGYELVNRFKAEGAKAFEARSKARHTRHPSETSSQQVSTILNLKHRYPTWGPVTIKSWLEEHKSDEGWPASSTIGEVLKRHGLVKPRVARKRTPAHTEPLIHCQGPNEVWSADYKGQFRLGNKRYCYPLTLTDNYSRYLLCCDGFEKISGKEAIKSFKRVFTEYGLPQALRTDNGVPFASIGLGGLTPLSIWLLKLGVMPERIEVGRPEQNGRHERMHRTLKESILLNPRYSLRAQQEWFDRFMKEFNEDRPHQALQGKSPASVYERSPRNLPGSVPQVFYPEGFLVRKVRTNGGIKYAGKTYYVSELLHQEPIGLEPLDEERAIVYFARLKLGIIDARLDKITRP